VYPADATCSTSLLAGIASQAGQHSKRLKPLDRSHAAPGKGVWSGNIPPHDRSWIYAYCRRRSAALFNVPLRRSHWDTLLLAIATAKVVQTLCLWCPRMAGMTNMLLEHRESAAEPVACMTFCRCANEDAWAGIALDCRAGSMRPKNAETFSAATTNARPQNRFIVRSDRRCA